MLDRHKQYLTIEREAVVAWVLYTVQHGFAYSAGRVWTPYTPWCTVHLSRSAPHIGLYTTDYHKSQYYHPYKGMILSKTVKGIGLILPMLIDLHIIYKHFKDEVNSLHTLEDINKT